MSERPPPGVTEDAALDRAEGLTPGAVERVLADFRSWLEQTAQAAADQAAPVSDEDLEPIDLFTLLGQLTALRHEVHLQTRATRAQQEQNAETLRQLGEALDALQDARETPVPHGGADEDELLRPLLMTLVDLYDALALAAREVRRVQEALRSSVDEIPPPTERVRYTLERLREWEAACERARGHHPKPAGLLARWLGSGQGEREALAAEREAHLAAREAIAAARECLAERAGHEREPGEPAGNGVAGQVWRMLDSIVTGYTMSVQRLERALRQHDLEPIPCVGQPFDPERMEVLDVVFGSGRPSGEVIEEIRRGYLWRGDVFRYAQVRVAKS